jgi:DNA-binding transcriptional LysR family regulator
MSTARDLLEWLRDERRCWAEQADEDEQNTFVRLVAQARRDQLATVLARLERDLPVIESEAVEADRAEALRLAGLLDAEAA